MVAIETFSPAEVSAVTGASIKAVYKVIGEPLPRASLAQRDRRRDLTRWGAVCFVIDRAIVVRRQLYASILERKTASSVRHQRAILSYASMCARSPTGSIGI